MTLTKRVKARDLKVGDQVDGESLGTYLFTFDREGAEYFFFNVLNVDMTEDMVVVRFDIGTSYRLPLDMYVDIIDEDEDPVSGLSNDLIAMHKQLDEATARVKTLEEELSAERDENTFNRERADKAILRADKLGARVDDLESRLLSLRQLAGKLFDS